MAEPTADITGGESSWLSPEMVSSLVQLAPALLQMGTAGNQKREAQEMQRALGPRVNYQIPEEAKRALGISEELARPREMAGQTYMQYQMDQEMAKAAGRASKGATNAQDLLAVITELGKAGQEGQLKLGITAAADYNRRQQDLARALAAMATYQDRVTADRQLDWNQRAAAAAAMKESFMKNRMGGLQGLTQVAAQFLGTDAGQDLFSGIGGGGGIGSIGGGVGGSTNMNAANAITGAGSMQNSQFGNYGNPAGGSGMGAMWQNQMGGYYGD
jgi:hypothetical protein